MEIIAQPKIVPTPTPDPGNSTTNFLSTQEPEGQIFHNRNFDKLGLIRNFNTVFAPTSAWGSGSFEIEI